MVWCINEIMVRIIYITTRYYFDTNNPHEADFMVHYTIRDMIDYSRPASIFGAIIGSFLGLFSKKN